MWYLEVFWGEMISSWGWCMVSHVQLFAIPWTVAHQAPLSMEFFQARLMERVAIPSSRGSSWPRDQTQVSSIAGRFFTIWATRKVPTLNTWYVVAQTVKCLPTLWETRVQSLGQEDPLEEEMAPHSSTLAWKVPWTEERGRLQSVGLQRIGHDWATSLSLSRA